MVYYYRARYYGQYSGSFLSRDRKRHSVFLNSYLYVDDGPTARIDPLAQLEGFGGEVVIPAPPTAHRPCRFFEYSMRPIGGRVPNAM
jgi:hypothetical protein